MKKLSILLPCLVLATAAHGSLLLEENFDALTTGDLNGQNGWTAETGVTVAAGGLDYSSGSISIDGGANRVQSNKLSPDAGTPLATKGFSSQSGEVWFSLTLEVDTTSNGPRYWFFVSDTTSLVTGLTASIADNNTGSRNLFAEIRNNSTPSSAGSTTTPGEDVIFVVGRLSKDGTAIDPSAYDLMELWVNPSSMTLGTASATANGPGNSSITEGIANFGLLTLSNATTIQWDNLRIGTTQTDVVPEPASALLLAVGALGLMIRRRRQH